MECILFVCFFVLVYALTYFIAISHTKAFKPKIVAEGNLLVVDVGNVVISEPLVKLHGLFDDPDKYVVVEFDPSEPVCVPCAGNSSDDDLLDWELTFKHSHDQESGDCVDKLHLKIMWDVSSPRTIVWRLYDSYRGKKGR